MADDKANRQIENQAYMNRIFCSTKERVSYILYTAFGTTSIGKYDVGSEIWCYKVYGILPESFAKAKIGLGIYDMINDPVTAAIIDNMRTRWGKFKPFQFLALLPSVIVGIFTCMLPIIANGYGFDLSRRLLAYMIILYANETISAFFGGGGYIGNVFTPNPAERTSLLVSSKFVGDLCRKLPEQILNIVVDLITNKVIKLDLTKTIVSAKWIVWVLVMIPTIMWYINSKERVAQSEKPPHPVKGLLSVFRNRPLLVYTLSDLIDDINVGQGGDLYYTDVLRFNTLTTVAGIPGSPISYASYGFVSKFREKFSTKTLWFLCRGSTFFRETLFFLVGLIGGKEKGLYLKKLPMALTFGLGNCVEMCFYATRNVIGDEINFEVLDYCEWQNGYRVEATVTLMKGYFTKLKNIFLNVINAKLLQSWAGYQIGADAIQTSDTKYRLFIIAFGPKLIFDALCFIPMIFYNLDKSTRERMYIDLEKQRALRSKMELLKHSDGDEFFEGISEDDSQNSSGDIS